MDQRAHLFAWITPNRLQTAIEELIHAVNNTMAVDPTPGEKFLGRPASPRPTGLATKETADMQP
jgi:hypothetical protein